MSLSHRCRKRAEAGCSHPQPAPIRKEQDLPDHVHTEHQLLSVIVRRVVLAPVFQFEANPVVHLATGAEPVIVGVETAVGGLRLPDGVTQPDLPLYGRIVAEVTVIYISDPIP